MASGLADTRVKSQSDSNLLTLSGNGNLRRNSSMDDMDCVKKNKGFLYRLVRPWKWHRKKKKTSMDDSSGQRKGLSILC